MSKTRGEVPALLPVETVDITLAPEPGLDWPSAASDLQTSDQVLREETIIKNTSYPGTEKYFIQKMKRLHFQERLHHYLTVQREAVTPPVVDTGDSLQALWVEGSRGSRSGLEIRVQLVLPRRPLPHSHLVDLTIGRLHQAHAVTERETSEVPATANMPGQTLQVELQSVPGDPGGGAGAGELLDHLLAGFDRS